MRIALILLCQLVLVVAALAQNAAQDAAKSGGVEGDPSGAIRSLGGVGNGSKKPVRDGVEIPDDIGHVGHAADQLPPGTSPPGSSASYRAPRPLAPASRLR